MARSVILSIGTHKGGFLLRSGIGRARWKIEGPFFPGEDVNHLTLDMRDGSPRLIGAVNSMWWGPSVRMSDDMGTTWKEPTTPIRFAEDSGLKVNRVWQITPGNEAEPGVLYAGVDPGTMFRSADGGDTWAEIASLTKHPTREGWNPGAGGLMVHSIVPHPDDPSRMHIGISAAGTFETNDGGRTWSPRNKDVLADFLPDPSAKVGHCVHHLESHPDTPDVLYQQNHCGVYRSDNRGEDWVDISEGLPSRFGFPLVIHPHDPDTVYVVPEQGPEFRAPVEGKFAVFRSENRGARWKRLSKGMPSTPAYVHPYRQAMAADALDQAGLYLGTSTGQLFASFDDGDSWETLWDMLPPIYSLEVAVV